MDSKGNKRPGGSVNKGDPGSAKGTVCHDEVGKPFEGSSANSSSSSSSSSATVKSSGSK
ncbi:hypothetical protein Fmac_004920 [Flemingia macrophylla]|uniref:Uncharacterized protein n=1 Tax=Flemingia macrophylla TaxID=520843 RepID=A0ABD1N687_9FABA